MRQVLPLPFLLLLLALVSACSSSPPPAVMRPDVNVPVPNNVSPPAAAHSAIFEPPIANSSSLVASDYVHHLSNDALAGWSVPSGHHGAAPALGCFHLKLDGKISDAMIKESSGDAELDSSVLHALLALTDSREQTSVSVPSSLRSATADWLCLRFKIAE